MSVPDPGYPPFYNATFFEVIGRALSEYQLKVSTITEKEWHSHLLQNQCTMEVDEDDHLRYIPCSAELRHPASDWRRARMTGLGPD